MSRLLGDCDPPKLLAGLLVEVVVGRVHTRVRLINCQPLYSRLLSASGSYPKPFIDILATMEDRFAMRIMIPSLRPTANTLPEAVWPPGCGEPFGGLRLVPSRGVNV